MSPVARVDDRFLFRQSAFLKFFWYFGLCAFLFFQSRNLGETGDLVLALQDRAPAPGRAAAKLPCLDLRFREPRHAPDDAMPTMPRVLRLGVEVLLLLIVTGQLSCLVVLHSVQVSVWICLFLQC